DRTCRESPKRVHRFGGRVQGNQPGSRKQAKQVVKSLAVLHVSQLVTMAGPKRPRTGRELSELAIIPDGGMLIRDGRIGVVGPSNEIENEAVDAEVIDARGKVVLPGFVDAHTQIGRAA